MIPKKDCTKTVCPLCESRWRAGSTDSDFIENNGACLQCCMFERVPSDTQAPAVDDTFNDDTPAQTFGDISDNTKELIKILIEDGNLDAIDVYDAAVDRVNNNQIATKPFASFDLAAGEDKSVTCDFLSISDDTPMRLIGIAGQARSGKDTLASYLISNLSDDWTRSSFADPIKNMLTAIGVDCSDDAKAVIDDAFGVTPRHMMQTLGTEWGRHTIDNDIWVKAFARLNAGKCVIVPDVRFENEAALVREHGVLIHLTGRGGIEGSHVSENALKFKPGDVVIDNSRDLAWLHGQVDSNAVLGDFIAEVSK